jgi:hypothetical protein
METVGAEGATRSGAMAIGLHLEAAFQCLRFPTAGAKRHTVCQAPYKSSVLLRCIFGNWTIKNCGQKTENLPRHSLYSDSNSIMMTVSSQARLRALTFSLKTKFKGRKRNGGQRQQRTVGKG